MVRCCRLICANFSPRTWLRHTQETERFPIASPIKLTEPFQTQDTFEVLINLAQGRRQTTLRQLLKWPWQVWRSHLIAVLEFLNHERWEGGVTMLRLCVSEAAYGHHLSPDNALMAACLMNHPTLVTNLIRQSGQFLWAQAEGKADLGWTHRSLFLMSAAPKEFTEGLPFQYYQALNKAAQYAHPMMHMGRFTKEFWDTLHRCWDSGKPAGSRPVDSAGAPRSSSPGAPRPSGRSTSNVVSDKYHKYPEIIAGKPEHETIMSLQPPIGIVNTPEGPTVMSRDVTFRWMRSHGSARLRTGPGDPVVQAGPSVGRVEDRSSVDTGSDSSYVSARGSIEPVTATIAYTADTPETAESGRSVSAGGHSVEAEREEGPDFEGEEELDEEVEDGDEEEEVESGEEHGDGSGEYAEAASTKKRKKAPEVVEARRSLRLRTRRDKTPPPPTPPPPKRTRKAKPKAKPTKPAGGRKRKTAESDPPDEEEAAPPAKQRKKDAPKAPAVRKPQTRRGRK